MTLRRLDGIEKPFRIPANGERCGACGETGESILSDTETLVVGDILSCNGCGADHEVMADGLRLMTER